ncbi:Peptidase M23B [Trichormus variabilis ATCC 29413]|uniref:Peptidase M23B n=2 Tax=Anabaena variabilis TaxID=264691 RepID=Q3MCG9_TRIV2|nr:MULTISPECIES: M23 family metallopeptidase [Nostocaceae]ABA21317.1 Peptidase M23B [Trichormus variabilis ATCC 29413]MBC1215544.1 M23 family metallopeptidase [Trichormus variabilis ARAD]MBC1258052.1 M23 family metallopeptidase [Trichormus variabilis V5]MBC1270251.1 M23 family metallopeptidase [Trichormus variabilis FSR]MBC1303104.1 M23 family metallopeptidase [Trichormus variabilis N2B]
MINRQERLAFSGATLLALGLNIFSFIALFPKAEVVIARETRSNKTARSSGWLSASFPVENFQAYTSAFGYRRSATGGDSWEFHSGLDIAAPQGSYIRNWWAGTVIKVGDRTACGTHIVIKSGQWEHTYCHMEGYVDTANGRRFLIDRPGGIQIWEGQTIPTGARIGRVGMTGRTTGPHLHWGLKYANNYVDPAMVLREMFSQQQIARGRANVNTQQSQVIIQESNNTPNFGY